MKPRSDANCAFPSCQRMVYPNGARGFCHAHYMQGYNRKDWSLSAMTPLGPSGSDRKRARTTRPCSWCGEPVTRPPSQARSEFIYCCKDHHYKHWHARADAALPVCSVDGCAEKAKYASSGLCKLHYGRKMQGRSVDGPRKWRPAATLTCEWCGSSFKRRHAQTKATAGKHSFCSQKCYHAWLTDKADARYVDDNGYVWLRISKMDEPRRTFARQCAPQRHAVIAEHRLVVAEMLGRRLDRFEQVHHINGVKDDNRPENLEVQGNGDHQKYHADIYAEVRALRAENERLQALVTA